jgi:anti-sigma factor RsiW
MSKHVDDLLALDVAGVLDPDEQARVRTHLEACATCAAEAQRWGRLAGELRRLDLPTPAADLAERTLEVVQHRIAEREQQAWTRATLGVLIAFGWTLTLVTWLLVKLLLVELAGRFDQPLGPIAVWFAAYLVAGWVVGGTAALLLGRGAQEEGRMV